MNNIMITNNDIVKTYFNHNVVKYNEPNYCARPIKELNDLFHLMKALLARALRDIKI